MGTRFFAKKILKSVMELILKIEPDEIYTVAYKGGHPDDDFAHVAAVLAARNVYGSELPSLYEAPLYNSYQSFVSRFSSFIPAPVPVIKTTLTRNNLMFKIKVMLSYRSQMWIVIIPAFLLSPLGDILKVEPYRRIPDWNYMKPPHKGKIGYETLFVWCLLHIRFSDFREAVESVMSG